MTDTIVKIKIVITLFQIYLYILYIKWSHVCKIVLSNRNRIQFIHFFTISLAVLKCKCSIFVIVFFSFSFEQSHFYDYLAYCPNTLPIQKYIYLHFYYVWDVLLSTKKNDTKENLETWFNTLLCNKINGFEFFTINFFLFSS